MMFKHTNPLFWLILGGICVPLSCNVLQKNILQKLPAAGSTANTPLTIAPNTDTVSIDIFTVRLDPHQNELLQQLWQELDEQSLPPQLRRELLEEGFRVGILGNLISPALARLLNISADAKMQTSWGEFQEYSAADIVRSTGTRNMRILSPEMRAIVKVFDEQNSLPELTLFRKENGLLCAQTYTDALGLLCVSAAANKDGSAQIQIFPVVEYGVRERQIRMVAGVILQDESRPRCSFESLTVSQRLLPGQWLIMGTTTPDSAGTGKAFFVRKAHVPEQRLVAIRLSQIIPAASSSAATLPPTTPRRSETGMPERN